MKFGILYGIWRRLAGGGGPAQTGSAQTPPRGSGTESSAASRMRGAIEHWLRVLACERPRSDLDMIQVLDGSGMYEAGQTWPRIYGSLSFSAPHERRVRLRVAMI
jgi:hypothetical protein